MPSYYLPARCRWCGHALLTPGCTTVAVKCARCGGEIQVVPGEAYREEDFPLFDRIAAAVEASALPEKEVRYITIELCNVAARAAIPDKLLALVLETLPSLRFLRPGHSPEHEPLAHALGMLLAILTTHLEHPVLLDQPPANTLGGPNTARLARM